MQKMFCCYAGRESGQKWDRIPSKGPVSQWRQKGHEKISAAPTREWSKLTVLASYNKYSRKWRAREPGGEMSVWWTESLPRHTHSYPGCSSQCGNSCWRIHNYLGKYWVFFCKEHPFLVLGTWFVYLNLGQGLFLAHRCTMFVYWLRQDSLDIVLEQFKG